MVPSLNEFIDYKQMVVVYTEFGKFAGKFQGVKNDVLILSYVKSCYYKDGMKSYELCDVHHQTYNGKDNIYFPLSKVFMYHKLKEKETEKVVISSTVNMSPKTISQ